MESKQVNVSGNSQSIGTGRYYKIQFKVISGYASLHSGTHTNNLPLNDTLFTLEAPRNKLFDLSDFYLKGSANVVVWLYPENVTESAVNTVTYSAETNFNSSLARMFEDEFLTDVVTYGGSAIRAVIDDQEILTGDGESQYQTTRKTATFLIEQLPSAWAVGDTFTYNTTTYYTVEVIEQDEYTVRMVISQQSR